MSGPNKVRVAVNGYGVIGKRVAAAVALQEDMSLAGVSTALNRDATRVVSCNTTSIVRIAAITLGAMKAGRGVVSGSPRLVDRAGLTLHGRFAIIQIRI